MKKLRIPEATNIADPQVKARMMRETIALLSQRPDLGFILVSVVAAFIDGLAKGAPRKTRDTYIAYLQAHFPDLCKALGAEVFYSHIRCAAIHEFAPRPPFALAPDSVLNGQYAETREAEGAQWVLLNSDRIVADFLKHLDAVCPGENK